MLQYDVQLHLSHLTNAAIDDDNTYRTVNGPTYLVAQLGGAECNREDMGEH